jgi:hypothetical protein
MRAPKAMCGLPRTPKSHAGPTLTPPEAVRNFTSTSAPHSFASLLNDRKIEAACHQDSRLGYRLFGDQPLPPSPCLCQRLGTQKLSQHFLCQQAARQFNLSCAPLS